MASRLVQCYDCGQLVLASLAVQCPVALWRSGDGQKETSPPGLAARRHSSMISRSSPAEKRKSVFGSPARSAAGVREPTMPRATMPRIPTSSSASRTRMVERRSVSA